jgi:hypothetical protein
MTEVGAARAFDDVVDLEVDATTALRSLASPAIAGDDGGP